AVGSAISVAMDHRVDNRIMYTAGIAAVEMKMLGEAVKIAYGIPLSATSKNPFFDRKH
ncbi:MAG: ferredoxin domain-containing protein, partial [Bacteroidales bacterium]|nr:ferredoxin domain-containing protein [Bacteroidales bacterium]